jgi:hypothetical protein
VPVSRWIAAARARLADERGSIVVAVVVLTLMVTLGLATFATIGTQTELSRRERVRESAFNLAEGALNAQTFIIGRLGGGTIESPFPTSCTAGTPTTPRCPDANGIAASYGGGAQPDYAAATTWETKVRDNGSGSFYDPAVVETQPPRDANGDSQVWVVARATVRKRTRTLAALVKVEARTVDFPRYALTAGRFATTNSGRKTIVDTTGSLGIAVRCSAPPQSATCLDYDPSKGQVSPNNYTLAYPRPGAISADDLQGLEEYADAVGTHYATCPANPNGTVVVVDSGDCHYNDSAPAAPGQAKCCNSPTSPGIFIVKSGTVLLNGGIDFWGIVYAVNQQASSGTVVTTGGTAVVRGAVMVDGNGGISAGSSGAPNIVFDPRAFDGAKSFGTASIVQNTWREITP